MARTLFKWADFLFLWIFTRWIVVRWIFTRWIVAALNLYALNCRSAEMSALNCRALNWLRWIDVPPYLTNIWLIYEFIIKKFVFKKQLLQKFIVKTIKITELNLTMEPFWVTISDFDEIHIIFTTHREMTFCEILAAHTH